MAQDPTARRTALCVNVLMAGLIEEDHYTTGQCDRVPSLVEVPGRLQETYRCRRKVRPAL